MNDWLIILAAIGCLWALWLALNLAFDVVEVYLDARRDAERAKARALADFYVAHYAQPSAEDGGQPVRGTGSFDS